MGRDSSAARPPPSGPLFTEKGVATIAQGGPPAVSRDTRLRGRPARHALEGVRAPRGRWYHTHTTLRPRPGGALVTRLSRPAASNTDPRGTTARQQPGGFKALVKR